MKYVAKGLIGESKFILDWIELIVEKNLPFSTVADEIFRDKCKMEHICVNTLMKYMQKLQNKVEEKIKREIVNNLCGQIRYSELLKAIRQMISERVII